jgi:hypothetical protein
MMKLTSRKWLCYNGRDSCPPLFLRVVDLLQIGLFHGEKPSENDLQRDADMPVIGRLALLGL